MYKNEIIEKAATKQQGKLNFELERYNKSVTTLFNIAYQIEDKLNKFELDTLKEKGNISDDIKPAAECFIDGFQNENRDLETVIIILNKLVEKLDRLI